MQNLFFKEFFFVLEHAQGENIVHENFFLFIFLLLFLLSCERYTSRLILCLDETAYL